VQTLDEKGASKIEKAKGNGTSRMQFQHQQVVIPVDCVVPDMPASIDDESGALHGDPAKLGMDHYVAVDGRKNGANNHYSEPVVDLSIPMNAHQPDYMYTEFVPRQGQDIFDTWCVHVDREEMLDRVVLCGLLDIQWYRGMVL
jgi:hypothetical protein